MIAYFLSYYKHAYISFDAQFDLSHHVFSY
jgi:hypothetical protein